MEIGARKILIYLSLLYQGDWDNILDAIREKKHDYTEQQIEDAYNSLKYKAVTIVDPEYPQYLKNCYKPPFVLFYYGDLSLLYDQEHLLSVIGARKCSEYGKKWTEKIISDLNNEYVIVSGFAAGIDTIAQTTAYNNGGRTVAILGSGIDYCYPSSNKELYEKLKEKDLILSEYPAKTLPNPNNFPFRNRLIAALCNCLLVTEAKSHSGTSITVNYALNYYREIMCLIAPINSGSECNRLIKSGAYPIENAQDVRDIMTGVKSCGIVK